MSQDGQKKQAQQATRAVVCLDPQGALWNRLRDLLDGPDCTSEFIVARSSAAPEEILAICRRLVPALIILEEARIPELPFSELRELIGCGDIRVLVSSDTTDDMSYERFIRQGCSGVLPPEADAPTLRRAIHAIFDGELWIPRRVLSKLARGTQFRSVSEKLTRRETEILELIRLGLTNQQIADRLFLSRETIRWHVRSLYSKMGVDSRMAAIRDARASLRACVPKAGNQ